MATKRKVLDQLTTLCVISVASTADEAIKKSCEKLSTQSEVEKNEYVFSAVHTNIYTIQEDYNKVVVAELWVERIPRFELPNGGH